MSAASRGAWFASSVAVVHLGSGCAAETDEVPNPSDVVYEVVGCPDWRLGSPPDVPGTGPTTTRPPAALGPGCEQEPATATVSFRNGAGRTTTNTVVLPWTSPPQALRPREHASVSAVLASGDSRGVMCSVLVNGRPTNRETAVNSCQVANTVEGLLTPPPED